MSDYSIKLGDSVGSGVHVHSQGEIYPVVQMYIGQEKVPRTLTRYTVYHGAASPRCCC